MTAITRSLARAVALLLVLAGAAVAADLSLPMGARLTMQQDLALDSYPLPVGPWSPDGVPVRIAEGQVRKSAWRLDGATATTLQILAPLRTQLEEQGYSILFECKDDSCGGFDFRFATEVLPAPQMYVDLADFRYLAAVGPEQVRFLSILVSRSASAGFVQVIQIVPSDQSVPEARTNAAPADAAPVGDVASELETRGHVVLSDLVFETGSSALGKGEFKSLEALARYLKANPKRRIVLVGHTDGTGSLDGNMALSKRRSASVRDHLVSELGVDPAQVSSDGVGYLSPVATNLTRQGRLKNRRVEAVLIE